MWLRIAPSPLTGEGRGEGDPEDIQLLPRHLEQLIAPDHRAVVDARYLF